jgi:hypothetical protein
MAANKVFRFGPVAVPAAVGNLLNPPTAAGGVNAGASGNYIVLRHIRIINRDVAARTFSGFIGATGGSAANTEFIGSALSIPANSYIDWYGAVRLDVADFFTGVASVVSTLSIQGEGEIGVAG